MTSKIIKILEQKGPILSSELARHLASAESISYNTATQRVARNSKIGKFKGFFVSGQSLLSSNSFKERALIRLPF